MWGTSLGCVLLYAPRMGRVGVGARGLLDLLWAPVYVIWG